MEFVDEAVFRSSYGIANSKNGRYDFFDDIVIFDIASYGQGMLHGVGLLHDDKRIEILIDPNTLEGFYGDFALNETGLWQPLSEEGISGIAEFTINPEDFSLRGVWKAQVNGKEALGPWKLIPVNNQIWPI